MSTLLTEPAAPATNGAVVNAGANGAGAAAVAPATVVPAAAGRWEVPEDLRHDSLRKFMDDKNTADPAEVARSLINAQQMIGREKIPLPKTDEDWANTYKALGQPEAPEAYEFKRPEKLPDGLAYNEDKEKMFRTVAHQAGLNPKQAAMIYEMGLKLEMDGAAAAHKMLADRRGEAENALKRKWGNGYEGNVAVAKVAFSEYATPDLIQALEESGYGNDPRLVEVFALIGKELLGDDKLKGAAQGRVTETPADLDKAITEFRSKFKDALHDRYHAEHELRVKEMSSLFERRFPTERNSIMGPA